MTKVFIHPGFPKTGTTTLQDYFLGPHPKIVDLAQPYSPQTKEIEAAIIEPDGYFDQEKFDALLRPALDGCGEDQVMVFSEEVLVRDRATRKVIAERLYNLYPQAEVIFTIRNQFGCIQSYYAAAGRQLRLVPSPYKERHVTLKNYLSHAESRWQFSYLSTIDFYDSIRFYEELFGKDKIHILLFEDFIHDTKSYIENLCAILSIDSKGAYDLFSGKHSNSRSTENLVRYHKFRSLFLPSRRLSGVIPGGQFLKAVLEKALWRGDPHKVDIPEEWKVRLGDRYKQGNRILMQRYGLPLGKFSYPL